VQNIPGYSNFATSELYAHADRTKKRSAVETLAGCSSTAQEKTMAPDLKDMLLFASKNKGTELYLTVDEPIEILVGGKRSRINLPPMTADRFDALLRQHLDEHQYAKLCATSLSGSLFELDGVGLVRAKIANGTASFILPVIETPARQAVGQNRAPFGLHRLTQLLGMRMALVSEEFFFGRIFPLPFLLIGAVTLYFGCANLLQAQASMSWPITQGTIEQSIVKAGSSSVRTGSLRTTFRAKVDYRFTVGAVSFLGHRVTFGDFGSSDRSHPDDIAAKYPPGSSVVIHYDPDDPEESVIDPGIKLHTWFEPGAGLIFLLSGLLMAIFLPKAFRARKKVSESR
jgi:hypothetical protein